MKNILIHKYQIALQANALPGIDVPDADYLVFDFDGETYAALDPGELTDGYDWTGLRESWQQLEQHDWRAAAKAAELLGFHADFRYCRRCGGALRRDGLIRRVCDACGAEYFAPMNAAIMVLVTDDRDRALLVHAKSFKRPFYGLVAGFVETGETLKECVAREVKEETNLDICDISYADSQSWPFPSQLMIGFRARLRPDSAELRFADGELTAGGFFSRDALPPIASAPSLAHRLIQAWMRRNA